MMNYDYRKVAWIFVALAFVCVMAVTASGQYLNSFYAFDWPNGANPYYMSLVQGTDGNLYGTTQSGGAGQECPGFDNPDCGTVFRLDRYGKLTTLYSFCVQQGCPDGEYPYAGLVLGEDGNFYGTTEGGGANGMGGTVFRIGVTGNLTTLYSFC